MSNLDDAAVELLPVVEGLPDVEAVRVLRQRLVTLHAENERLREKLRRAREVLGHVIQTAAELVGDATLALEDD